MPMTSLQQNKAIIWDYWQKLNDATADRIPDIVNSYVHEDIDWNGPHPINRLMGVDALISEFWQPLWCSFPDIQRKGDIFMGGQYEGSDWVCATGYFVGTFARDWLSIPATGQETHIRFGEFCHVVDGKIARTYIILDLLDVIRQAGYRLLQNDGGKEALVPGPLARDGILLTEQDESASRKSLRLVEAMVDGLLAYDQSDLSSMNMAKYWHPGMLWYGPCGIGATQGIREFEDYHQRPFLRAFPDRRADNHKALIAEGLFVAWAGWPGLQATHRGTYLGRPATGKQIEMRGVDWWKRDGDLLVENWVFIDMIHLFLQLGVDLLDRLQDQIHMNKARH